MQNYLLYNSNELYFFLKISMKELLIILNAVDHVRMFPIFCLFYHLKAKNKLHYICKQYYIYDKATQFQIEIKK